MPNGAIHRPRSRCATPSPATLRRSSTLASDPEVTRWFSWGPYTSGTSRAPTSRASQDERERGERLDFVIDDAATGVVGVTGLAELSRRDRRAMVGTWLGRPHWGSGANAESKALILHLAFEVCGLERVGAYSNPRQRALDARAGALGFRHEGVLRAWHRHGDLHHDVNVFGLLREEWRGAPFDVAVEGEPPAPWVVSSAAAPS